MRITLISFTRKGAYLTERLVKYLQAEGNSVQAHSKYEGKGLFRLEDSLKDITAKAFLNSSAIIFVGAAGIAVRAIAPFLNSKASDPAVIVINETGEDVIPILSGHLGGANKLAESIAVFLGGRAVITTATDLNNVFAVDIWANKKGLHILNPENIKHVSAALLNGQKTGFKSDFPQDGELPEYFTNHTADTGIMILGPQNQGMDEPPFSKTLFLRPRQYVVGIGCRKGIAPEVLEEVFIEALQARNISQDLVFCIATIDLKKDEEAIIRLCNKFGCVLKLFTKEELMKAQGSFASSEFVRTVTGADNVCERAAFLASDQGTPVMGKTAKSGVTVAIAVKAWRCTF